MLVASNVTIGSRHIRSKMLERHRNSETVGSVLVVYEYELQRLQEAWLRYFEDRILSRDVSSLKMDTLAKFKLELISLRRKLGFGSDDAVSC
jgi:hypothetical protein